MIDYLHANQASVLRNKVEKHDTRPRLSTATVPQGQQTVMAVPLVSFQGNQGQAFSISGSKGQVTMVPVAVSQSGMSSATTAVIVNSTDLASAGGGISLEAVITYHPSSRHSKQILTPLPYFFSFLGSRALMGRRRLLFFRRLQVALANRRSSFSLNSIKVAVPPAAAVASRRSSRPCRRAGQLSIPKSICRVRRQLKERALR